MSLIKHFYPGQSDYVFKTKLATLKRILDENPGDPKDCGKKASNEPSLRQYEGLIKKSSFNAALTTNSKSRKKHNTKKPDFKQGANTNQMSTKKLRKLQKMQKKNAAIEERKKINKNVGKNFQTASKMQSEGSKKKSAKISDNQAKSKMVQKTEQNQKNLIAPVKKTNLDRNGDQNLHGDSKQVQKTLTAKKAGMQTASKVTQKSLTQENKQCKEDVSNNNPINDLASMTNKVSLKSSNEEKKDVAVNEDYRRNRTTSKNTQV